MQDKTYQQLLTKMKDVSEISPQEMGIFTPIYKIVIPYFKRSTWQPLLFGSFLASVVIYLLLGASVVVIVSILQYGF